MSNEVSGGVTAAKGFKAAGVHCGIRKNKAKRDLALIVCEKECTAAAVYTTNRVCAAPIALTREHLKNGRAQAILINSGNANACAPNGAAHAGQMCRLLARETGLPAGGVIVNSTGVIGVELPVAAIESGMRRLVSELSENGSDSAAEAIMTTDTRKKEFAVQTVIGGKTVTVGGIAKGSGMIAPHMATMLALITTDCAISSDMLHRALRRSVERSYNLVVVDGDTSTNDMCAILASGLAGNAEITAEGEDADAFYEALCAVNRHLAREIARDGEGATKLVTCLVEGAENDETAALLGMSVLRSPLVKAAMFGSDANWGRVLCAMGYSGAEFDPAGTEIRFASGAGEVLVCQNGQGLVFDEDKALRILSEPEVFIKIDMAEGHGRAECFGCDLTYDYVKINGDYRT